MLRVGVGDEELRCGEFREWLSEWEGLVEEKARGDERGVWVVEDAVGEVAVGCVEDDGGDVVMFGGEVERLVRRRCRRRRG